MANFEIKKQAVAGTLESSDLQILLDKGDNGIEIELTSSVEYQYGKKIRALIADKLKALGIEDAKLKVVDKGALDCTIIARTITAVHRASGIEENYDWEAMEQWSD